MILRLILKKDGSFKTKDISFFWNEDYTTAKRIYKTDDIPESAIQELIESEIVGSEMILESSDKWGK